MADFRISPYSKSMNPQELQTLIGNGEDTRHQFKRDFNHIDALAAELVACANTAGGMLLVGVADNGVIEGLTAADIARLNQMLSNAASQHVKPPINPVTTNIRTEQGLVMVIEVEAGLNKPYMDGQGRIWVKSSAELHESRYNDSEDIEGPLPEQYRRGMASHAFHLLPYRGLGSGIPRAVAAWPEVELIDDRRGNQFKVTVKRLSREASKADEGVSGGVSGGVSELLAYIKTNPGKKASELSAVLDTPLRSVERWLKQLKDHGLIEFKGVPKTGGYHPVLPKGTEP